QRKSAGGQHAALHRVRHRAQVRIAVIELAPGIADADDRLVLEKVRREAFRAHPCAAREALIIGLAPPLLAAQFLSVYCGHGESLQREQRVMSSLGDNNGRWPSAR